jgi:hypothetical protein
MQIKRNLDPRRLQGELIRLHSPQAFARDEMEGARTVMG